MWLTLYDWCWWMLTMLMSTDVVNAVDSWWFGLRWNGIPQALWIEGKMWWVYISLPWDDDDELILLCLALTEMWLLMKVRLIHDASCFDGNIWVLMKIKLIYEASCFDVNIKHISFLTFFVTWIVWNKIWLTDMLCPLIDVWLCTLSCDWALIYIDLISLH